MQTLNAGYRGISLLIDINWDRLLYAAMIIAALWGGAEAGTMFLR